MRSQNNCAHAFQEVKNKGKKRVQFCLDCSEILFKGENLQKVANKLQQSSISTLVGVDKLIEIERFSTDFNKKNSKK